MSGHPNGVRRILDNAADRALSAGPPSRRGEVLYTALWLGASLGAAGLLALGRHLSRSRR